jgi:hypothetical protein
MKLEGPMEVLECPEKLKAFVVKPGSDPLLHGYSIKHDLCSNYSFHENFYTTLCGKTCDLETGEIISCLLTELSAISVAEAPCHAGVLVRLCGGDVGSIMATVSIALSQQARHEITRRKWVFNYIEGRLDSVPGEFCCPKDISRPKWLNDIKRNFKTPLDKIDDLSRVLGLLYECGLKEMHHLAAAWVMTRLPVVVAEAYSWKSNELFNYPITLPKIEYTGRIPEDLGSQ